MSEHFSLQWDNFYKNMSAGMQSLLESEDLVDVTLAVEGRHLKAHKMVLSLCSPYFRQLFQSSPCKHPIVFMKDVSYIALSDLLQFMYQGEVQVAQENLPTFIKTAEALQIKGLTGDSTNQNEEQTDIKTTNETIKRTAEVLVASPVQSVTRVKKYTGPASKRVRVRSPSPSSSAATPVVPAEVAVETNTSTVASNVENAILMKMEPNDNIEASTVKEVTEQSQDSYVDESLVEEDAEDYTLMETNEDDPKPGTSFDGIGESQGLFKFFIKNGVSRKHNHHAGNLILHKHIYRFNKIINGRTLWICAHDEGCPAKCNTSPGKLLSKVGTHNHQPPIDFILEMEKKGMVKYKELK